MLVWFSRKIKCRIWKPQRYLHDCLAWHTLDKLNGAYEMKIDLRNFKAASGGPFTFTDNPWTKTKSNHARKLFPKLFLAHRGPKNLKKFRQKNSWNQINQKKIFREIAFLTVLNFFLVQQLILAIFEIWFHEFFWPRLFQIFWPAVSCQTPKSEISKNNKIKLHY